MKKILSFLLLALGLHQVYGQALPAYDHTRVDQILDDRATWSKNFLLPPHGITLTIPSYVPDSLKGGALMYKDTSLYIYNNTTHTWGKVNTGPISGSTTYPLTNGFGIGSFTYNGGTSGINVKVDTTAIASKAFVTASIPSIILSSTWFAGAGTSGSPIVLTAAARMPIAGTATGTNTYAVTVSPAPLAYNLGDTYVIAFNNSNTGASTININGLGAITLVSPIGTALATGDIIGGNSKQIIYNGTTFQLAATASGFVQNQFIGAQAGTNFWISGTGAMANWTINGVGTIQSTAYLQFNGGTTTYLQNETTNGYNGLEVQLSGNALFKFAPNGIFQRHNGTVVFNAPWSITGSVQAQTTTQTVLTYLNIITGSSGLYTLHLSGGITAGTGSVTFTVNYTDVNNHTQTKTYTAVSGINPFDLLPVSIWYKLNTTLTVVATVSGTVTYDAIATATQF